MDARRRGTVWRGSDILGKLHHFIKDTKGHTNFPELYTSADILAADIQKVHKEEEKDTYI